jgi:hypothetical protein
METILAGEYSPVFFLAGSDWKKEEERKFGICFA